MCHPVYSSSFTVMNRPAGQTRRATLFQYFVIQLYEFSLSRVSRSRHGQHLGPWLGACTSRQWLTGIRNRNVEFNTSLMRSFRAFRMMSKSYVFATRRGAWEMP